MAIAPATVLPLPSVADAVAGCGWPLALNVPPVIVTTGRSGVTVTSNEAIVVLPAKSVTITVSWVTPIGNVMPLAFGVAPADATRLNASDAGIEKLTAAPLTDCAGTVRFGIAPIVGAILSIFTTRVLSASAFPALSTAWEVIVVW